MSYYIIPIVLWVFLTVGSFQLMSSTDKSAKVIRGQLNEAVIHLANERATLETRKKDMRRLALQDATVTTFLADWLPLSIEGANPGQVGLALSDLSLKAGLVGNRRPTPIETDYPFGNGPVPVQAVGFSVIGEYRQAIRWLGQVEDRFPFARLETLNITSVSANEVEMNVNFTFLLEENKN